jgi:hypothetical protein
LVTFYALAREPLVRRKNTKNFYSKIEEKVSDARLRGETEKITPPFFILFYFWENKKK